MNCNKKISFSFPEKFRLKTFTVLISLVTSIFHQQVLAQLSENFLDGDFTNNPTWTGSAAHFTVNTLRQLQLNNTVAATSWLSVPFTLNAAQTTTWQFYLRQAFAGSANNYGRIYLVSSQQDVTTPLNGYYLQLGEALSVDAVTLFRQTGTASVEVCRATDGSIATSVSARIKVTRSALGEWTLAIDYNAGTDFVLEASGIDNVHTTSSFFGIRCTYTASNSKNFNYDDISITTTSVADLVPPTITSLTATSPTTLELHFSEPLQQVTAADNLNYALSNGLQNPVSSKLQTDQQTVKLVFDEPFGNGVTQTLQVKNIKDLAGNIMAAAGRDFMFFEPGPVKFKDVIITEIFADPAPQQSLPEVEFVEIYNRSAAPIDLDKYKLSDGVATATLSSFVLQPGQYLIMCASAKAAQFTSYGKTLGTTSFPALNNAGDVLVLTDASDVTVDSVSYSDTWYKDDEKQDGGWSLELIDPDNFCSAEENWVASESEEGGTPGKQNSVFANKPDLTAPMLTAVLPLSDTVLTLLFNERLEKALPSLAGFSLEPNRLLKHCSFASPAMNALYLELGQPLQSGVQYKLTIQNVYDCSGNVIQPGSGQAVFELPDKALPADVVINEVLFNPHPTGVDFVEVYNQSAKYINLKDWKLANIDDDSIINRRTISAADLLVAPGHYVVFTKNGNVLKGEYLQAHEDTFVKSDLPPLPDDSGSVVLQDNEGKIIDSFLYSAGLHSAFLKEPEGVSLERISMQSPAGDQENWRSASSVAGFATPGYLNSNARSASVMNEPVTVSPEIFIPQKGQPDFAQINYLFDHGGYVANVKIFDAQGREIKQVASNVLLGTEGFFRWDGDLNNGSRAHIGSYMVWFEVFDAAGDVKTFRQRVAVAGEF